MCIIFQDTSLAFVTLHDHSLTDKSKQSILICNLDSRTYCSFPVDPFLDPIFGGFVSCAIHVTGTPPLSELNTPLVVLPGHISTPHITFSSHKQ